MAAAEPFPYASRTGLFAQPSGGARLPGRVDAVIIGGGIMGCAAAWYLASAGLEVVLLDRGRIAYQQSGRNWGFVRSLCRDPSELPLASLALSLWPDLNAQLGFETGWRRSGCLFLAATEEELAAYRQWLRDGAGWITETALLSRTELARRLPSLALSPAGAIVAEGDGQAEPVLATLAFAKAAARAGATLVETCGVKRIESQAGAVCGVVTERGAVSTPTVVCVAGSQSHRLVKGLVPTLPQKTVRSTVALSAPVPDLNLPCFVGHGLGIRQRADGACILATDAGTDIDITLDSFRASSFFLSEVLRNRKGFSLRFGRPFWEDIRARISIPKDKRNICPREPRIEANAARVARAVGLYSTLFTGHAPRVVQSWAGNIDVMPDALPVIDVATPTRGLVVATGFSGHGFGLGPAVGKVIANAVSGAACRIDLTPFAADRFARGAFGRPYATI